MKKHLLILCGIAFLGTQSHAQTSPPKVLIEEHTGSWCGYCPDGHVVMSQVLANHSDAIGVMVHNSDGMDFATGNTLSAFYVSGFPMATINRDGAGHDRSSWESVTSSILNGPLKSATVSFDSVLYNPTTRKMNIYVRADFTGNESGDIRFNGIIVEDGVTGTGSDYNQTNYYNGTVGHPMYGLGNPIVGYVHDHVARYYLGGAYGTYGSLPTTINAGESYTKHYTYTVPASFDDSKLSVVAMVSRFDGATTSDRIIINANSTSTFTNVNYNVGVEENANIINSVYPNPTTGLVNVATSVDGVQFISVMNMMGEVVLSKEVNLVAGSPFTFDLTEQPAGIYLLKVGNSTSRIIKK